MARLWVWAAVLLGAHHVILVRAVISDKDRISIFVCLTITQLDPSADIWSAIEGTRGVVARGSRVQLARAARRSDWRCTIRPLHPHCSPGRPAAHRSNVIQRSPFRPAAAGLDNSLDVRCTQMGGCDSRVSAHPCRRCFARLSLNPSSCFVRLLSCAGCGAPMRCISGAGWLADAIHDAACRAVPRRSYGWGCPAYGRGV